MPRPARIRVLHTAVALAAASVAACGGASPTNLVVAHVTKTLVVSAGSPQTVPAGNVVPIAPRVRAVDAAGQPVVGDTIVFRTITGGSVITGETAITDANGFATLGSWTLGGCGGLQIVTASRASGSGGVTAAQFMVTATGGPVFCIELRYVADADPTQKAATEAAAARWNQILAGSTMTTEAINEPSPCGSSSTVPAINQTVKSVLIFVDLRPIPAPGPGLVTLGQAGPCLVRDVGLLPAVGILKLNSDFLASQPASVLSDVVLHELAHVLGYGTIWDAPPSGVGVLQNPAPASSNPVFNGSAAVSKYIAAGGPPGATNVPVEACGSSGTVNGHWRETVFGAELMTGYINGAVRPLSAVSIASFKDIGYTVNYASADPYILLGATCPGSGGALVGSAIFGTTTKQPSESLQFPVARVGGGKVIPIVRR